MTVEIERSIAINVGYHLRSGMLIEQAQATRTLALAVMERLKQEGLLADADIADLDAKITTVITCLEDHTLATSEAHMQTAGQSVLVHDIKSDRRRLIECMERAFRARPELTEFRQGTYHGTNVPALCTDLNRKLSLAKDHADELGRVGAGKDFLAKLETKLRSLETSSGSQEATISSLPDNRRHFCEAKGRLYFAIKDINNAGRALYSSDPEGASKFNLKALYGRTKGKRAPEPVPPPAPTPAAK